MTESIDSGDGSRKAIWQVSVIASVVLNIVLIEKIVIYDLNTPLRPLCKDIRSGPFLSWPWDAGIEEVEGPLSEYFRDGTWAGRLPDGYRVDDDGTVYISLRDRNRYEELIWNWTSQNVRRVIKEDAQELALNEAEKRAVQWRIKCDMVRRIAIEDTAQAAP